MSSPDGLTDGCFLPQEVFSDVDSGFGPSINGTYVVHYIPLVHSSKQTANEKEREREKKN